MCDAVLCCAMLWRCVKSIHVLPNGTFVCWSSTKRIVQA
jgi:hypothetical protein